MTGEMADREVPWTEIAKRKQAEQRKTIEAYEQSISADGLQDSRVEAITSINDVAELANKIAAKEFTSVEVTNAYIQKAILAHSRTNCLTEILFTEAIAQARELDPYVGQHGKTKGPLHGVCMTLKDQFDVQGHDTTLGYVGRAFQHVKKDALLVKILKEAGVVLMAKTNIPQSIMWCETENPLFGVTTHPLNSALTPGGSTGGESALLASHGSLLGWGTDIGGSVRIPAHMCGLYSLKPSSGRLPYLGCRVSTSGQEHVPSVVGPLGRSLASVEFAFRTVIEAQPWKSDPTCHPMPWRADPYQAIQSKTTPLRIGLLLTDGFVQPHPPITRLLTSLATKLRSAGHTLIPWSSPAITALHKRCIEIMDAYYISDGCEDLLHDISAGGEPMLPRVEALVQKGKASGGMSVYRYWKLNERKREAQREYLELWTRMGGEGGGGGGGGGGEGEVDVLLTPVMPHVAVPHRKCQWVGYTKVWNLLDFSAVVLPGGVEREDLLVEQDGGKAYVPDGELDRQNWDLWEEGKEDMVCLPIGVQLVGRRLEEEKVLGVANLVEEILRSG